MGMLGMALSVLASLAMLVFGIQILITAFKTSTGWGLISLLVPLGVFVFIAKHWEATKTPFLRSVMAFVVALVGSGLSMYGAMSSASM
jgi:hypothetical protein